MIWKIENDNLYRTTYLSRDHNNDSLAEIIEGIEIENGKIILQNILGDIYVLDKNEKYKSFVIIIILIMKMNISLFIKYLMKKDGKEQV